MADIRRRRFPTLSLVTGLALLVSGPLGWAWLQYGLYREEEDLLAELRRDGINHSSERGVFLAQESGDTSEDMWEIMTESWRAEADRRFPWLRPLDRIYVHERISLDLAKRIASLPRVEEVGFLPVPDGLPARPTLAEAGIDLDDLAKTVLVETDLDQPIPTGRTLVGDKLPELESTLSDAWAGGESRIADRYAVSVAHSPYKIVGRSIVDGERRKYVSHGLGWSDRFEIAVREKAVWRSVSLGMSDDSLWIQELPEGPYHFSDYESYPPYVQPELNGGWGPSLPPLTLRAAGVEYAEELPDGAYAIRFRPFDAYAWDPSDRAAQGATVHVDTMTLVVRPDLRWCVERGEAELAGTRRVEWLSKLVPHGDYVVVREQLARSYDVRSGAGARAASQTHHLVFDWDLNPHFAADEFTLASAGAGPLGPPRTIPWYRRWYVASALLGLLLTAYAMLRIIARRLLARRELRTAARQSQPTAA